MNSTINITRDQKYLVLSDRYLSAAIGILFGSVLIFGAGFSHS
jgi:6-phosphogluconolactonase (cycloisomerase 2 family)